MEDYKNDTFWYPTKLFFPIKILVDREFASKSTYTSDAFSCNMFSFSAYPFFKLILNEWYPLGLRLYVRTGLSIFEKEGKNESEQEYVELKKHFRSEIHKKEQKTWKNLLNQYERTYKEDILSKLTFRIQCDEELFKDIRIKFISYLVKFSQDKLRSETGFTMINFAKQMSALLSLLKLKLSNNNSGCGLNLEEKDFTSYLYQAEKMGTDKLFPPFGKSYCFLELLQALDFLKIIKIRRLGFTTLNNPNELVHINLFSSNVDVLLNLKELEKLTAEGCKDRLLKLNLLSNKVPVMFCNMLVSSEDKNYYHLKMRNKNDCRFKKSYKGSAEKYNAIKAVVDSNGEPISWLKLYNKVYSKYPYDKPEEELKKLTDTIKEVNRKLRSAFNKLVRIEKMNIQEEDSPIVAFALKVVIEE